MVILHVCIHVGGDVHVWSRLQLYFESDESDVHVYYQWVNISCMTLCEYMYHNM